jgi:hypothetical protein
MAAGVQFFDRPGRWEAARAGVDVRQAGPQLERIDHRLPGAHRQYGGRKGLESAAHTAKPSARAETGGFAFCPRKCQLPGRHRWGCRTGNGRGDSNLRPPCVVTRDEGPSPTTKTYAPRSRPQGAFLRRWNRPIISFVLGLSQHQRPGAPGIEAISG